MTVTMSTVSINPSDLESFRKNVRKSIAHVLMRMCCYIYNKTIQTLHKSIIYGTDSRIFLTKYHNAILNASKARPLNFFTVVAV